MIRRSIVHGKESIGRVNAVFISQIYTVQMKNSSNKLGKD
jgi:hypothetical protein